MAKYKSVAEAVKDIKAKGRVNVIGKASGHAIPIGPHTVNKDTVYNNGGYLQFSVTDASNFNVYSYNLGDVESAPEETKENIQANITALEEQIAVEKTKLTYMEESGSDKYDPEEFKVYKALQTLKGKKSDIEKAKIIAALIKG